VDVNDVLRVPLVALLPGNRCSVPLGRRRVGTEPIYVAKESHHQRKLKINFGLCCFRVLRRIISNVHIESVFLWGGTYAPVRSLLQVP
jgi:hypothetical protein